VTILGLSILIISISYVPGGERATRNKIIEGTLGTGSTETRSGVTLSRAYPSIAGLVFDRSHDTIRFSVASGSQMVSLPSGQIYERLPYAIVSLAGEIYTIAADGTVTTSSGDIHGRAPMPQDTTDGILITAGSGLYRIDSDSQVHTYPGIHTQVADVTSSRDHQHIVWTESQSGTTSLYRDGERISRTTSGSISRIALSDDGESIMTVEK
jgi:hypothetical protein